MEIRISHNFAEVQRQLDRLSWEVGGLALNSAVQKTMQQAKTQMVRAITSEFNITAGKVRQKLIVERARFRDGKFNVRAALVSDSMFGRRSINLINFDARQARRLGRLTVKIRRRGGRIPVRGLYKQGAFIGNKGRTVFERIPGTLMKDRHSEKLRAVTTIDVPQMFNTRRINAPVVAFIRRKFPELFEREARYYTDRFNSSR